MKYYSTRKCGNAVNSSTAITSGISSDGGLFIPEEFPQIKIEEIIGYKSRSYQEIAKDILYKYLSDFTKDEISQIINKAYGTKFDDEEIVPVSKLNENLYIAELWHGPTSAFKDIALQMLPHLMTKSVEKCSINEQMLILVATSGDTGKAALEGFKDIANTNVVVYYPADGVSDIQYMQMATQDGGNTSVVAVEGNFDDTQNGVKTIFADKMFNNELYEKGYRLTSANSINWGRLVPQIVYYFSSYVKALSVDEIHQKTLIDFVVPTGNFGNILAGYYAKQMGLPIGKLICASNSNHILYDFLKTGTYDTRRELKKTISPSMDILISSNLERLLHHLSNNDTKLMIDIHSNLERNGYFTISKDIIKKIHMNFDTGWVSEEETKNRIKTVWEKYQYLLDPHTAVGFEVLSKLNDKSTKRIIMSTANPYKFSSSVLESLTGNNSGDGFIDMEALKKLTKMIPPSNIENLKYKKILHEDKAKKKTMREIIKRIIK